MSAQVYHKITPAGQIVRCTTSEQLITNPRAILTQLINTPTDESESSAEPSIRCLYNLGEGVSAFRQQINDRIYYWNSIQLEVLPFITTWELQQHPDINGGKHFICPWDGHSPESFSIGAPMNLPIPEDLIVHFHIEYRRYLSDSDIQLPQAGDIPGAIHQLSVGTSSFYLTCFSLHRNTCISLPLPNLYPDSHLCVGNSFRHDGFIQATNHAGLVSSAKSYLKAWSDTQWNLDLLGGPNSLKMAQYRRFVRFDAATGTPLPFSGCDDWDMATSMVPLEDIYRPWHQNTRAIHPTRRPEDANLVDTTEFPAEEMPEP